MRPHQKAARPTEPRYKAWFIAAAVLLLFVSSIMILRHVRFNSRPAVEARLNKTIRSHFVSMPSSSWILDDGRGPTTPAQARVCEELRQSLIRAAEAWCPDTELGRALKSWVPQWGWGIQSSTSSGAQINVMIVRGGQEVVTLTPRVQVLGSPPSRTPFFCNPEERGRMVFAPALKMPDHLFAAFMLHEMGHAYQYWHQKMTISLVREVDMHLLSQAVLDSYSKGEYSKAIGRIVDRAPGISKEDFWKAFRKFQASDLEELDAILGAQGQGKQVAAFIMTQHAHSIAFEAVRRAGGTLEDMAIAYEKLNEISQRK